jgi:hypothetical protein
MEFKNSSYSSLIVLCLGLSLMTGCVGSFKHKKADSNATPIRTLTESTHTLLLHHEEQKPANLEKKEAAEAKPIIPLEKKKIVTPGLKKRKDSVYDANNPNELDFEVENKTGRPLFITCFSYQRRRNFERWRWIKSPVYEIAPYQTITIDVDTIPEKLDRSFVFGYLGVFQEKTAADEAIFELLNDKQKIDLDLLINLKGKKVTITIESYGMKGNLIDYDFISKNQGEPTAPSDLIFAVENNTGKIIFVTCFVYQKNAKGSWVGATEAKDDMATWHYEKTSVLRLAPGEIGKINAATILTMRDKSYVRGDLAIFDESQEKLAYSSIYELLPKGCKLSLGPLSRLTNKKIVIDAENYGIMQDFFNYIVKPTKRIDFQGVFKK